MPRSHKITCGLPWFKTYSAANRKSSIGADGPRFRNTGLPLFPASIRSGKFCIDLGLTFQGIVDGDDAALAELAELAGAPPEALRNNALRREEGGWRLHGERVLKVSLRRDRLYVCPACLAEDAANADISASVAGYGRTVWLIDHVRTCAKHSVGLVEVAPGKPSQSQDFAHLVGQHAASLIRQAKDAPRRQPSALERYLADRLGLP